MKEFEKRGEKIEYEDLVKRIKERDFFDMNRKNSPLLKALDALVIDTSDLSIDEQIRKIINIVNNKK